MNPRSERRNVVVNQTFDTCSLLNGTLSSPFAGFFTNLLADYVPKEYLQKCDYPGGMTFHLTFDPEVQPANGFNFVVGTYSTLVKLFNRFDPNILSFYLEYVYY